MLIISIVERNVYAPQFTQDAYTVQVNESALPGQLVARVMANDIDSANLTYTITGGDEDRTFTIDYATGILLELRD